MKPEGSVAYLTKVVNLIWPSTSHVLVSRTDRSGNTVSSYRISKNNESRIVMFALASDGKVAVFGIRPDPDVR